MISVVGKLMGKSKLLGWENTPDTGRNSVFVYTADQRPLNPGPGEAEGTVSAIPANQDAILISVAHYRTSTLAMVRL